MIICNKKMEKLLEKIKKQKFRNFNHTIITIKNLMKLIDPKFVDDNGCILFDFAYEDNLKKIKEWKKKLDEIAEPLNLTYREGSNNEVLIEYYLNDIPKVMTLELLWFALKVIECWEYKLKKQFPKYHFTIILSYDKERIDTRFHRQREGKTLLTEDDLDGYKGYAILLRKF